MSAETALLPEDNSRESALFFVVAALCFLAVLAALTAKATYGAATSWTSQVEGEITIQLVDADQRAGREAVEIVSKIQGISNAEVMSIKEMKAQLREALNVAELPDAVLPLPVVVRANGGDDASLLADRISKDLSNAGLQAEVAAASDWVGDARLNVLHLSGATDRFVANLFERRFWLLGLRSGAIGAVAALGTTAFMIFAIGSSQRIGFLPQLSLDVWDFLILLITPIVAGFAARFAARSTVLRTLSEYS